MSGAGALRLQGLDRVHGQYWDETFYAADATAYLGRQPAAQRPGHPLPDVAENSWMQPPLGKWLIAGGELALGSDEWGWRASSAVAGTAGVLVLYLLALELTGSVSLAALAALLLALDGLDIVQSRIAMLDIFAGTFALAGLYLTVRSARPMSVTRRLRLLLAAGGALGAGVACKWSAAPFVVVAALVGWRAMSRGQPVWSLRRRVGAMSVAFIGVPAAVYLISYTSFFTQNGPDLVGFVRLQWDMLQYGRHFQPGSAAASPAWSWPFLKGAIDYTQALHLGGGLGLGVVGNEVVVYRVLALGNPVLWWAFLGSLPFVTWQWVRRAARRRPEQPARLAGDGRLQLAAGVAVAGFLAGWAPWLVAGRTEFVDYMIPAVPFMALTVAVAVGALARVARGRAQPVAIAAGGGLSAAALTAAAVYYPLWTGIPVAFYTFAGLRHLPGVH